MEAARRREAAADESWGTRGARPALARSSGGQPAAAGQMRLLPPCTARARDRCPAPPAAGGGALPKHVYMQPAGHRMHAYPDDRHTASSWVRGAAAAARGQGSRPEESARKRCVEIECSDSHGPRRSGKGKGRERKRKEKNPEKGLSETSRSRPPPQRILLLQTVVRPISAAHWQHGYAWPAVASRTRTRTPTTTLAPVPAGPIRSSCIEQFVGPYAVELVIVARQMAHGRHGQSARPAGWTPASMEKERKRKEKKRKPEPMPKPMPKPMPEPRRV